MGDYEITMEILKRWTQTELRPISFYGPLGSGKFNAAMELAKVVAEQENIFPVEISKTHPSIESYVDVNIANVIKGNNEGILIDDPLTKAVKLANSGTSAAIVIDVSNEEFMPGIEEEIFKFLMDKCTYHNGDKLAQLEAGAEKNLTILLVSEKTIQPDTSLGRRTIIINDFNQQKSGNSPKQKVIE